MTELWEVGDFLALPEWRLRWSAAPFDSAHKLDRDVCLITMEDVERISHVAYASDGRIYDALGLRTWLSLSSDTCVVPGCPITHVELLPCYRAWKKRAHLAWRFMAQCMVRHASHFIAQTHHVARHRYERMLWQRRRRHAGRVDATNAKKEPMWKRVLEVNRRRRVRFPPIQKGRPLIPHARSAFTPLGPLAPALTSNP